MLGTTTLWLIIGVITFIYMIYDFIQKNEFFKKKPRCPGPTALPLIGHAHLIMNTKVEDIYSTLLRIFKPYPSPIKFWLGNQLWFTVHDPDHIKIIATSSNTIDKGDIYRFNKPFMGNGLVTASGPIWKAHRRLIQPSFHPNYLRSFTDEFHKHSKLLVDKMAAELNGPEFDVIPYFTEHTLNVALGSFVGISQDTWDPKGYAKFYQSVQRILQIFVKRIVTFWLHPDIIYNLTQYSKDYLESAEYVHNRIQDIIEMKRMELLKTEKDEIVGRRITFLDFLLEARDGDQKFSNQDIRDEACTMISAAFDTTLHTLEFVMFTLACHPEIQDKIYEELCSLFGTENLENAIFEYEDLQKMEYLERAIKETLRIFPTVPSLIRKVKKDIKLGEYILPKGSQVVINSGMVHRDEKYWPDPFKFDPDRFLPEEVAKRNPYCYLPFSSGPRNCIGISFAMMEMKSALASILRAYVLKKDHKPAMENVRISSKSILYPTEPLTIRIVKREPNKS